MKKVSGLLSLTITICTILCSCGNKDVQSARQLEKYVLPEQLSFMESSVVSENDNFELLWDSEATKISLLDKRTGKIWSSTPSDFNSDDGEASEYRLNGLKSILYFTYRDSKDKLQKEGTSYDLTSYVESGKIKNGIRLTFYFDKIGVSVPVNFTLEERGLKARILLSKIKESDNLLYKVSLMPFFASAKNNTDSYLFVPSGNGALMNVDEGIRGIRHFNESVYGDDSAAQAVFKNVGTETIRMPVFGVKSENNGLLGVIDEGAELSELTALAGDEQYGYSCSYPTFMLRGYKQEMVESVGTENINVEKYSETVSGVSGYSVIYIPLSDDATYNGMATAYRDYLTEKYNIKNKESKSVVAVNFLGGQKTKQFVLGIPISTTKAATTLEQARDILEDIRKNTEVEISVKLTGFGSNGLDFDGFASGLKIDSVFGGKKAFKGLKKWCEQNGVELYPDAETVFISKSKNGISARNAARTINGVRAKYTLRDITTTQQNDIFSYLTGRSELVNSTGKIMSLSESLGTKTLSLSSLSNTVYSDYSTGVYFCRANMGVDVEHIYSQLHKRGYKIMSDSANVYAAVNSEFIYNAPMYSSKYNAFDTEIPFYHIVLHGITPLSGAPVNLAADYTQAFLNTVSLGCALSFTLTDTFCGDFIYGNNSQPAFSVYGDISDTVIDCINKSKDILKKVSDSRIVSYKRDGNLSETVFDNETVIYVNFGAEALNSPVGELAPYSIACR